MVVYNESQDWLTSCPKILYFITYTPIIGLYYLGVIMVGMSCGCGPTPALKSVPIIGYYSNFSLSV